MTIKLDKVENIWIRFKDGEPERIQANKIEEPGNGNPFYEFYIDEDIQGKYWNADVVGWKI